MLKGEIVNSVKLMKQFTLSKIEQYRQKNRLSSEVIDIQFPNEKQEDPQPSDDLLVFIVDDDPHFMQILNTHFSKISQTPIVKGKPIKVKNFATGKSCLAELVSKPDLVFLNYDLNKGLPNAMSGKDTYEQILEQNANTHVVILNQLHANLRNALHEQGLRDYIISDPSAVDELNDLIMQLLSEDRS